MRLFAPIAPDREVFTERGKRSHSIGLAKWDSIPEENILSHVKPVVLAKNDPAIIGVFPHVHLRHRSERISGWEAMAQS